MAIRLHHTDSTALLEVTFRVLCTDVPEHTAFCVNCFSVHCMFNFFIKEVNQIRSCVNSFVENIVDMNTNFNVHTVCNPS